VRRLKSISFVNIQREAQQPLTSLSIGDKGEGRVTTARRACPLHRAAGGGTPTVGALGDAGAVAEGNLKQGKMLILIPSSQPSPLCPLGCGGRRR